LKKGEIKTMSDENKIKFKEFNITLEFEIQPYIGDMYDDEVRIDCIEDLYYILKSCYENKYKDVFGEHSDIACAELIGLRIKAKDESGKTSLGFLMNRRESLGSITVDY